MLTKIQKALNAAIKGILLISLFVKHFWLVQLLKFKKIPRHSTIKLQISVTVIFVIFIVFVLRLNSNSDAIPRIRDYYSECNRSSELCDQEYSQYLTKKLSNKKYSGVENYIQYTVAKLNLKPLNGMKSLRPNLGPVLNDVKAFQYPIRIQPCRYDKDTSNIFVAIISAVENLEKREIIRQTWLSTIHQNQSDINELPINLSGYGFIIGQTKDQVLQIRIEEESNKHGDIAQINIIDNYYNLTLKVVGLMNLINKYCPEVDFVLKVDDDVFVNVRNLKAVIVNTVNKSEKIIYGSPILPRKTDRGGKWNISYEDWPWENYPDYFSGGAVLFSGIAIEPLLAAAQVIPYLPFEDTYILGLCTEKAEIKLKGVGRFFVMGKKIGPCHVYNYIAWPADSSDSMNSSYRTTEDFFKNVTRCFVTNRNGVIRVVNPYDYLLKLN